jgi:hypothetical protein
VAFSADGDGVIGWSLREIVADLGAAGRKFIARSYGVGHPTIMRLYSDVLAQLCLAGGTPALLPFSFLPSRLLASS